MQHVCLNNPTLDCLLLCRAPACCRSLHPLECQLALLSWHQMLPVKKRNLTCAHPLACLPGPGCLQALELLESPSFSATVSAPAPAEAAPSAAALTQQQEEEQQQQPGAPNSPASEAAVTPAVGTSAPASQMFEEGANYDADVESMFESLEDVTSALTGSLVLPEDSPAAAASAALAPAQPQAPASAAQVPAQPAAGPEGSPAAQPVPAAPTKDAGSLLKVRWPALRDWLACFMCSEPCSGVYNNNWVAKNLFVRSCCRCCAPTTSPVLVSNACLVMPMPAANAILQRSLRLGLAAVGLTCWGPGLAADCG